MRGEVDLERETQRLNVNVQPELGGTAAGCGAKLNPRGGDLGSAQSLAESSEPYVWF